MVRQRILFRLFVSALTVMLVQLTYLQSTAATDLDTIKSLQNASKGMFYFGDLDTTELLEASRAFNSKGFSSFGTYHWDNPLCLSHGLDYYNDYYVGRCVGLYQDERLSIYPLKDAHRDGDYGQAIIHGKVKFSAKDIWYGGEYSAEYAIEKGYIYIPRSAFPPHIVFSKECRGIRVDLVDETAEIVRSAIEHPASVEEIIVEYPHGYDSWHSRNPYLIQSKCFVNSRSYRGIYQPYLGPLKR